MEYATVVRGYIVRVEEQTLLYCEKCQWLAYLLPGTQVDAHRLKLVTGVEISARLVRSSGSAGKPENNKRRNNAADPKSNVFRLSIAIIQLSRSLLRVLRANRRDPNVDSPISCQDFNPAERERERDDQLAPARRSVDFLDFIINFFWCTLQTR